MDIRLNPQLTDEHQRVILKHLHSPRSWSRAEWTMTLAGFDALRSCRVARETAKRVAHCVFALFCGLLSAPGRADLSLAPVFGNHMVLQRDKPLPVWGRATPEAQITAQFAGQSKTVRAAANGDWEIVFDALPASVEGRELTVSGDGQTRTLRDVLIGEVWLCAGQSNMEFPLRGEATARAALAEADIPNLRLNLWRFATQYVYGTPFTKAQTERLTPERFYENQWAMSSAQSARGFSAIGWFFGREIQKRLGVPVGMISLAAGGSPTEAWVRRAALQGDPQLRPLVEGNWLDNRALGDWCRERGHQNLDKPLAAGPMPGDDLGANHPFKPAFLWDAGMARLIPFAVRGVLWYQGESNSLEERRVRQHEKLFPLLVRDWRAQWGQGDFPFFYCQLSGIATERGYKSRFWPAFRDQQRRFLETIPNSGMVVTSDIGARFDVHPTNKRDVALRLARLALAKTYGEPIEWSGPLPKSLHQDGASLILAFAHARGLKTSDGKAPRGFEIAGAGGVFYSATARLDGENIVLASAAVPQPRAARYAWRPFPDANLVNSHNLPASTFEISLP